MTFRRMLAVLLASMQVAGLGLAAAAEGIGEERIPAEEVSAPEMAENAAPVKEALLTGEEEAPAEFDGYLPAEPDAEAFPDVVREDAAEPLSGNADEVVDSGACGDNLTWTLYGDGLLEISGTGEMWDYQDVYEAGRSYTTAPWTAYKLNALRLKDGITKIGKNAFRYCSDFTGGLTIPDSVTSIGGCAFSGCSGFTGSLTIPDSVTTIGMAAFSYCSGFTGGLLISQSIESFEMDTFAGCGFTGSLIIPNGIKTIGLSAFSGCSGFTGPLVIPESVTGIVDSAFRNCSGLTEAIFEGDAPTFGSLDFDGNTNVFMGCADGFIIYYHVDRSGWTTPRWRGNPCYPINEVNPNILANGQCGDNLIWTLYRDGLLEISGTGEMWDYTYTNNPGPGYAKYGTTAPWVNHYVKSIHIGERVESVSAFAFNGCSTFKGGVLIADTVKTIGEQAFYECSGLEGSLTIPDSITSIESRAFSRSGFTGSLTIPDSVTSIGSEAFCGCSGFTGSLTIPDSVTTIGNYAFGGCSGFTGSLTIPDSVTTIGNYAFGGCSGFAGNLTISDSVTSIGDSAFSGCSGFTGSLTIPDSVTSINNSVFSGCSAFTGNLTIPDSVTTIGYSAFYGCSGFTGSLTIPDSVTTIGTAAFGNCSGFTGCLTIPDSMRLIGEGAFSGCSGFTGSLTIPDGVITIGKDAFSGCNGFTGDLIIPNASIYANAFKDCKSFTGNLTIGGGVRSIGSYAFSGCSGFTGDLIISNALISANAFKDCTGFNGSLILGDGVESVGEYAFSGCTGFTGDLTIGKNVKTIGTRAFENCTGFTGKLTLPAALSVIEGYTFYNCSGLTGPLTLPDGVTTIGVRAFSGCSGFTGELTVPASVTTIRSNAFESTTGIPSAYFSADAPQSVGTTIFGDRQNTDFLVRCEPDHADSFTSDANYDATAGTWYGYPLEIIGIALPLTVISQPTSQEVEPGTPVSFTVTAARGTAPYTYQWQYLKPGAAAWVNVASASGKTKTYSLTALLRHDGYKYRCQITDADGTSVLSDEALLTVREPVDPLTVTEQPVDRTAAPGTTVSFSVTAAGGKAPYAYQWQYQKPGASSWTNVSAASGKTETYSLTALLRHDGYRYRCRITDANGNSVLSDAALLTVASPFTVTYQPEDRTVLSGQSAPFVTAVTGGVQPYSYRWQYQKPGTGTWTNVTPASGGDTSCFTVPKAAARHDGWVIRCRIRDAAGSEIYTNLVTLTVDSTSAPVLTQAPVGASATPGETVTFSVRAEGPGKLSYQWQYLKPGASAWVNVSAASGKLPDYSLKVEMRHNGYRYRVVVSSDNGTSTVSGAVYLDVWEEILGAGDMLNGFGSGRPVKEEDPDFGWDLPVLDLSEKEEALWDLGLLTEADVLRPADEAE